MATYSAVATVTAGQKNTVHLFVPPQGQLRSLRVADLTGTLGFSYKVYTRKGACDTAIDKQARGGLLTSITDSDGSALVTFAAAHGISSLSDPLYVKGTSVSGYNGVEHTISSIPSTTTLLLSTAYTSSATGGYAQTVLDIPLRTQASYEIEAETVAAASAISAVAYSEGLYYENRDPGPYGSVMSWDCGLWVEVEPTGSGSKTFEITAVVL